MNAKPSYQKLTPKWDYWIGSPLWGFFDALLLLVEIEPRTRIGRKIIEVYINIELSFGSSIRSSRRYTGGNDEAREKQKQLERRFYAAQTNARARVLAASGTASVKTFSIYEKLNKRELYGFSKPYTDLKFISSVFNKGALYSLEENDPDRAYLAGLDTALWRKVKEYYEWAWKSYQKGALHLIPDSKEIYCVDPAEWVALAGDNSIAIPEPLRVLSARLKQKLAVTQSALSTTPDSVLKGFLGMAMAAYRYKPGARNPATGDKGGSIFADLDRVRLPLSAETIRGILREAETRFTEILQDPQKYGAAKRFA